MQTNQLNPITGTIGTLSQYWVIEDTFPIQIVCGAVAAAYLDAMLWMRVIGESRSGKSIVLQGIGSYPDFEARDVITAAATKGGYRDGGSLEEVMKGKKLLVIKDMASFSRMKSSTRNEVWALMRIVSDGELRAIYGSDAKDVIRKYRFNMLIGMVEGTIDRSFESQHGQRFVDVSWKTASSHKIARKMGESRRLYGENFERDVVKPAVADAVHSLIDRAKDHRISGIIPEVEEKIAMLAEQVAILRGNVPRNRERQVIGSPQIEVPSTLASSFGTLASGICMTRLQDTIDWTVYRLILRVARDSVPLRRRKILAEILQENKRVTNIAQKTGLNLAVVSNEIEDMKLLEVPDLSITGLGNAITNTRVWRKLKTNLLDFE